MQPDQEGPVRPEQAAVPVQVTTVRVRLVREAEQLPGREPREPGVRSRAQVAGGQVPRPERAPAVQTMTVVALSDEYIRMFFDQQYVTNIVVKIMCE